MPADKCYCRPNRDPLPRWPCEDASTAFKLCCLSATIYDVRCWGVQGDRDRYVDYSPGDVVGQKLVRYAWSGSPFEGDRSETQFTINCDAGDLYPNTNLRGDVLFMFPDPDVNPDGFDLQDAVNPWLPCPCIRTELRHSGLYYTILKTWVGVSWSYSCDTGLVSFRAVWGSGGLTGLPVYGLPGQTLAGSEAVVTADPDWYLDNEITIPYATANDTNRLSRFSVKLRMTCEAQPPEECDLPPAPWYECFVDAELCEFKQLNYHIEYDDGVTDEIFGTFDWASGLYNNPGQSPTMNITVDGTDGPFLYVDDIGYGNEISEFLMTADLSCIDGEVYFVHVFEVNDAGTLINITVTIWSGI